MSGLLSTFLAAALAGFFPTEAAPSSQVWPAKWFLVIGMTSADLAGLRSILAESSVVTWPDGRQDLITFWETEDTVYRCIDHIRPGPVFTEGHCFAPR